MNQVVDQSNASTAPALLPRVDVFEDETGLTLVADLPGVPKDKLAIDVDGDVLKIDGEIPARDAGGQSVHTEVQALRYRRAFTLGRELDGSRIQAEAANGVLKLRIPRREKPQPVRVAISMPQAAAQ